MMVTDSQVDSKIIGVLERLYGVNSPIINAGIWKGQRGFGVNLPQLFGNKNVLIPASRIIEAYRNTVKWEKENNRSSRLITQPHTQEKLNREAEWHLVNGAIGRRFELLDRDIARTGISKFDSVQLKLRDRYRLYGQLFPPVSPISQSELQALEQAETKRREIEAAGRRAGLTRAELFPKEPEIEVISQKDIKRAETLEYNFNILLDSLKESLNDVQEILNKIPFAVGISEGETRTNKQILKDTATNMINQIIPIRINDVQRILDNFISVGIEIPPSLPKRFDTQKDRHREMLIKIGAVIDEMPALKLILDLQSLGQITGVQRIG